MDFFLTPDVTELCHNVICCDSFHLQVVGFDSVIISILLTTDIQFSFENCK